MRYIESTRESLEHRIIEKFSSISNDVLIRNHSNFINIAKETFDKILGEERSEYVKKQNDFTNVILPIKETLLSFDSKITMLEKERTETYSDLRRQIKDLMIFQQEIQKETSSLSRALSTPFASGQWGEMQLRRVVEIAGMLPYCDFTEQAKCDDSRLRPDMTINLPGQRQIVVDSKAPVDAYIKAINSGDETYMDLHSRHIKSHIKMLGQKAYWEQFSTSPEFVLMFLPGESFFSAAVKKDPNLIEYGVHERVIVTTPTTLIALLKAISFSWKLEAIALNAKKIGEAGKEVVSGLERLFSLSHAFEKRMCRNIEEYEKINQIIEKTVLPAANKLRDLGMRVPQEKEPSTISSSHENADQLSQPFSSHKTGLDDS
jgi:DNA recombination protein RmuC